MTKIWQYIYTSAAATKHGVSGFGVWATSAGLSGDDEAALNGYAFYETPQSVEIDEEALTDSGLARFPAAFSSFHLPSGRAVIMCTGFPGLTLDGRLGNYFSHALILESGDWNFHPARLWGHPLWRTALTEAEMLNEQTPPDLPALELEDLAVEDFDRAWLDDFLSDPDRASACARIVAALIAAEAPVLVLAEAEQLPLWMLSATLSFPARLAPPFKSFVRPNADTMFWLQGLTPGEWALQSPHHHRDLTVIEITAPAEGAAVVSPFARAIVSTDGDVRAALLDFLDQFNLPIIDGRVDLVARLQQWAGGGPPPAGETLPAVIDVLKTAAPELRQELTPGLFGALRDHQAETLEYLVTLAELFLVPSGQGPPPPEAPVWFWRQFDALNPKPDLTALQTALEPVRRAIGEGGTGLAEAAVRDGRVRELIDSERLAGDWPWFLAGPLCLGVPAAGEKAWPQAGAWEDFWVRAAAAFLDQVEAENTSRFLKFLAEAFPACLVGFWQIAEEKSEAEQLKSPKLGALINKTLTMIEPGAAVKARQGLLARAPRLAVNEIRHRLKTENGPETFQSVVADLSTRPERDFDRYFPYAAKLFLKHSGPFDRFADISPLVERADRLDDEALALLIARAADLMPLIGPADPKTVKLMRDLTALISKPEGRVAPSLNWFLICNDLAVLRAGQGLSAELEAALNAAPPLSAEMCEPAQGWVLPPALAGLKTNEEHVSLMAFFGRGEAGPLAGVWGRAVAGQPESRQAFMIHNYFQDILPHHPAWLDEFRASLIKQVTKNWSEDQLAKFRRQMMKNNPDRATLQEVNLLAAETEKYQNRGVRGLLKRVFGKSKKEDKRVGSKKKSDD